MSAHGFFRGLAWVPAALLLACIGGTGTDTDNGINSVKDGPLHGFSGTAVRVADPAGNGIPGVDLFLHTPGYRGDSGAPEDLLLDSVKVPRSDSLGYARFNLARPGRYVVEARLAGAALFFDTLAVADVKSLAVYTFLRRPSVPAKGAVRLESGLRVVSGTVFVRGTGRFARLDSAGGYDLGLLPADVERLAIGLSYRAVVREARIAEQKPDTSKPSTMTGTPPVYTCREVSVDSAARFASRDSWTGQIPPATLDTGVFVTGDTAKLDTARLSALERSCDSLPGGTVIAVQSRNATSASVPVTKDSSATYIAVGGRAAEGDISTTNKNGTATELVPLNGCVASPGLITTSYEVDLIPSATGGDLYVGDVADACRH
jgi:hypothetical protein